MSEEQLTLIEEIEPLDQNAINYLTAEVSYDFCCADTDKEGADRIRWSNRYVVGLLKLIHKERETIAARDATITEQAATIERATGEREEARDTNRRLNRRCQKAERRINRWDSRRYTLQFFARYFAKRTDEARAERDSLRQQLASTSTELAQTREELAALKQQKP